MYCNEMVVELIAVIKCFVKILCGTFHGDRIGSETSGFWETIVKSK